LDCSGVGSGPLKYELLSCPRLHIYMYEQT
jgi:hypothetical protein